LFCSGDKKANMARISVAIPAYNAELYLREALDSVLSQSLQPHEILVVNDGSKDATDAIARSYGDQIRYIVQENQGLSGARNTAIHRATGDWIAFFDSDDIMQPEKLAKQMAAIDANPDLILTYTGFTFLYEDGRTEPATVFPANELWPALRYRSPILPSTSIVKRDALLEVGCFRKITTEDWDLWFRLIRRYPVTSFREVPESLLLYRQREDSLSKKFIAMSAAKFLLLDTQLLVGLSGFSKVIWKRKIEARFLHDLALSFRAAGDPRYWEFAIESLAKWPLWGTVVPWARYRVVAHMLYVRLQHFRFDLRYWWPVRRCDDVIR
jgi:glycosyltransferase involved in cell wall biosynthesis